MADQAKDSALQDLRKRLVDHKEIEARVKSIREQVKASKVEFDKTEDDLKALQSVGQIVGEVLRQLDEGRCKILIPESVWLFLQPACHRQLLEICI